MLKLNSLLRLKHETQPETWMDVLILLPLSASQCRPSPLGNNEASQKGVSQTESRDQDPHQIPESCDGLGHVKKTP